jgi:molecular chaperone GrpE
MSKQHTKDWQRIKDACEQDESEDLAENEPEVLDEDKASLEYPSHEALESQLMLAENQAQENLDKAVRAMAELDNVRRRAEREVANAHRFGVEKLVKELIPVMDSLESALAIAAKDENKDMADGIELTMKLLMTALEKFEVTLINPEGQPFNPQEHEAMSIQVSDEVPPNTVMIVFQKGYKLSDRVIRPARVIVSKATT